jgi:ketosteroid isomerase-like protein
MHKLLMALAVSVLAAGPAMATDQTDIMSLIHQWVNSFNKGDMKTMAAACVDDAVVIDDIPPHEWHGPGACSKWSGDFLSLTQSAEITESVVAVGKPWHVDVTGDRAYVVAPTTYSFKQKGSPVMEKGIVTITMQKSTSGWRMTGWAWADR